ncbi:ATP-dependent DNA helicase [Priestia megaterium]|uniref:ATP-dependent DNA helicase n=1 Tax=Priestia megaterium TaxID=1404 RepID=UPI003CFE944C
MQVQQEQQQECGTHSILLQHKLTGEFLGFVASCKRMSCPSCGQRLTEYLKEQVGFYTQTLGLKHFLTLTTGTNLEDLKDKFSKITELLRHTEQETFIKNYLSKYPDRPEELANQAYYKWVHKIYDEEHFYIWLYGKKLTQNQKDKLYTPLSNIGVYVTDVLNQKPNRIKLLHLKPLLEGLSGRKVQTKTLDSYFERYIEPFRKKWKGVKYKDTKYRRKEFIQDFEQYIMDIAKKRYFEAYPDMKERQAYREKIPVKGSKLSYIRTLEFHKNGKAHFHGLTNYYVPIALIKKVMKYNVYDVQEVEDLQSENLDEKEGAHNRDFNQYVANYVVKYITKSTLEVMENIKKEDKEKVHIIASSEDISIVIEDAFKSGLSGEFNLVKTVPGVLSVGSKKFDSIYEFDRNILPHISMEHPNKPIQEIILYLQDYVVKSRRKMSEEERKQIKEDLRNFLENKHNEAFANELERREVLSYRKWYLKKKGKLDKENLSREQFEAIKGLLNGNQFAFMVGYAGAGKTYTLTKFLDSLNLEKHKVAVVSYAAKAKERVKEVIRQNGIDSSDVEIHTIHSLCGAKMGQIDYPLFYNDWDKPLPYDVVIIDEYSLVPLSVLINFLGAISRFAKVIFVGDEAQLNPVGSKNPLHYFMEQKMLKVDKFELTKNFRSGEGINDIANSVRIGKVSDVEFQLMDFEKMAQYKEKGYQILSNSVATKDMINSYFQKDKNQIKLRFNYNINDIVMITKNDRYKKFFNGEFAKIVDFDEYFGVVTLETSENVFTMTLPQLNSSVEPAHAITVHKSQGSEFEKVLIVLDLNKTKLTNRNLLYTAITRAKSEFAVMTKQKITDKDRELLGLPQN